jgi:hypothetical protein
VAELREEVAKVFRDLLLLLGTEFVPNIRDAVALDESHYDSHMTCGGIRICVVDLGYGNGSLCAD